MSRNIRIPSSTRESAGGKRRVLIENPQQRTVGEKTNTQIHCVECSARGSADGKKVARDARRALESLGIRRPPSTRSPENSILMSDDGSRPSTAEKNRMGVPLARHFAERGTPRSPAERGPPHRATPTAAADHRIISSPPDCKVSSPGVGDASWDAELEDLLTWTEGLGSVPEIGLSPG